MSVQWHLKRSTFLRSQRIGVCVVLRCMDAATLLVPGFLQASVWFTRRCRATAATAHLASPQPRAAVVLIGQSFELPFSRRRQIRPPPLQAALLAFRCRALGRETENGLSAFFRCLLAGRSASGFGAGRKALACAAAEPLSKVVAVDDAEDPSVELEVLSQLKRRRRGDSLRRLCHGCRREEGAV